MTTFTLEALLERASPEQKEQLREVIGDNWPDLVKTNKRVKATAFHLLHPGGTNTHASGKKDYTKKEGISPYLAHRHFRRMRAK